MVKFKEKHKYPKCSQQRYAGDYRNGVIDLHDNLVMRPLTKSEQEWLQCFNDGYVDNNHREQPIFQTNDYISIQKKALDDAKNAAYRDIFAIGMSTFQLEYLDEAYHHIDNDNSFFQNNDIENQLKSLGVKTTVFNLISLIIFTLDNQKTEHQKTITITQFIRDIIKIFLLEKSFQNNEIQIKKDTRKKVKERWSKL